MFAPRAQEPVPLAQPELGLPGDGANLGDFQGRTVGLGPVVTYLLPRGDENFVAEVRWLPEIDTKRRLEGDYVWMKLVYQF